MQQKIFIPEGLTVNSPFFYIIQYIPSGKYYAGYCSAKKHCDSTTFMTKQGYQTCSKNIKELILLSGLDSFKIDRIRHFVNRKEAQGYERKFLKRVNARDHLLFYNRSNGDYNGLLFHSTETKLKISLKLKAISSSRPPVSLETREKIRKSKLGKKRGPRSKEHIEKLANACRGRVRTDEQKEKMRKPKSKEHREKLSAWQIDRVLPEETKKKISISMKGRPRPPMSEEQKEKIRNALKGKKKSESHIRKMSISMKLSHEKRKETNQLILL
jgi:hypothetical protein